MVNNWGNVISSKSEEELLEQEEKEIQKKLKLNKEKDTLLGLAFISLVLSFILFGIFILMALSFHWFIFYLGLIFLYCSFSFTYTHSKYR